MNKPSLTFIVTEDWYFCSHRLPLATAALEAGMKVTVLTRISNKRQLLESLGIKVVPVEIKRSGTNPLREISTIFKLRKILQREKPDLVHLVAMKPVILGGLACRLAGIRKTVSAIAGMGFLFSTEERNHLLRRIVLKLLEFLARTSRIIVQNPEDADLLRKAGVSGKQIHLIRGSGVDLQKFYPTSEPDGIPIIMLASRLLWDKGIGEFVQAANILKKRDNVQGRFVIVGAPDYDNPASITENDLKKWTQEGVIEWWGISNNMPETFSKAHIFCLPSYREGLPKVLLEAMACGRACVTSDAPGCHEAVKDGVNGFLVPVKDAEQLSLALKKLIINPELRKEMGARGRKIAEEEFSQEKIVSQTFNLYKKILENKF